MESSEAELHALMETTGLKYTIDDDGDVRCHIGGLGPSKDRTHLVWVSNRVDEYDQYKDRDVFAIVAELKDLPQSYDLLLKLLQIAGRKKGGSLVATETRLVYRIDFPLTASADHLRDSVFLCGDIADELELALTKSDGW